MACRSDGYLLQPSAPARAIDASFALEGNPQPHVENVHAVMATHSEIGGSKWAHVLVIGLNASFELAPEHIAGEISNDTAVEHLLWSGYQPSDTVGKLATPNVTIRAALFSAKAPLQIPACGYSDFGLYHIAPISKLSGFSFLGEVGKWVPVAVGRVAKVRLCSAPAPDSAAAADSAPDPYPDCGSAQVSDTAASLAVDIVGVPAEKVELVFAGKEHSKPVSVVCTVGAAGTATATFDGSAAKCA